MIFGAVDYNLSGFAGTPSSGARNVGWLDILHTTISQAADLARVVITQPPPAVKANPQVQPGVGASNPGNPQYDNKNPAPDPNKWRNALFGAAIVVLAGALILPHLGRR